MSVNVIRLQGINEAAVVVGIRIHKFRCFRVINDGAAGCPVSCNRVRCSDGRRTALRYAVPYGKAIAAAHYMLLPRRSTGRIVR